MQRRPFLFSTAAIIGLSGCGGDGDTTGPADETETSPAVDSTTPDNENGSGSNTDTETSTTESTGAEPELPEGLRADGINLELLRTAVEELVMTGAFRSIGGIDYFDQDEVVASPGRSVSGINESERGRELEGVALYEKVDEGITPEEATIDTLLEHNRLNRYFEDGNAYTYTGSDSSEPREVSYDTYLQHVLGYAEEVFSMLEAFQYGSPEWDTNLGVFRVPITDIEGGEGYEVENAEMRVTRDGLPVAAGGRIVPVGDSQEDAVKEERLIVLRSDEIELERPEWVDAGDSEN